MDSLLINTLLGIHGFLLSQVVSVLFQYHKYVNEFKLLQKYFFIFFYDAYYSPQGVPGYLILSVKHLTW